jgi:hypothetical protein
MKNLMGLIIERQPDFLEEHMTSIFSVIGEVR